jgi:hypothetical protein
MRSMNVPYLEQELRGMHAEFPWLFHHEVNCPNFYYSSEFNAL